jgi:hypothetical protein
MGMGKDMCETVMCMLPPSASMLMMPSGPTKECKVDVKNTSDNELKKMMEGIQLVCLVPPATSDKVEWCTKFMKCMPKNCMCIMISMVMADAENCPELNKFQKIEKACMEMCENCCIIRCGYWCQNLAMYTQMMMDKK